MIFLPLTLCDSTNGVFFVFFIQYIKNLMSVITASLLALLGSFALATDINIHLSFTIASIQSNNTLVLQLNAYGGRSPYLFSYVGIPQDWSSLGNDLVIRN